MNGHRYLADVAQVGIGTVLITTPGWVYFLYNISVVASAIAAICGAVIGVHGVWRLIRRGRGA